VNRSTKIAGIIFGVLLTLAFLISCKHVPYGNNKAAGKYYTIRGFKMYCEIYGSGKPLLMIHGDNGSISTFSDIIPAFSDEYKVIVADSRAQGKSKDLTDSISFEMMADDYAALLDSLHVDSAYVIGWSDGGVNALLLAMRHPEKVKKIASSGANLWPDSTAINGTDWLAAKKEYEQNKDRVKMTDQDKRNWKLLMLDWAQPHITPKSLNTIKCPTLVMSGDHDLIKKEHSKIIAQNIPQSNLWIVPHSGHGILFEHRRKFISTIKDFFDRPFEANYSY